MGMTHSQGKIMFLFRLNQLLLLLWKLSTVFIIPIIMFTYVYVMNIYLDGFLFSDLDQGTNLHKLSVLGFYLVYLLFWKYYNKRITAYFKKLEY